LIPFPSTVILTGIKINHLYNIKVNKKQVAGTKVATMTTGLRITGRAMGLPMMTTLTKPSMTMTRINQMIPRMMDKDMPASTPGTGVLTTQPKGISQGTTIMIGDTRNEDGEKEADEETEDVGEVIQEDEAEVMIVISEVEEGEIIEIIQITTIEKIRMKKRSNTSQTLVNFTRKQLTAIKGNMMHLGEAEAVVEAVTFVEMIEEEEEITLIINVSKKTNGELIMLLGETLKTQNQTTNHTLSLREKKKTRRMVTETTEVKDLLGRTLGQVKSMMTLVTKSSNGTRRQIIRKMMLPRTMAPKVEVPPLRAPETSQEETIKSQESTTQWVQQQTTSRLLAQ
jgi:hypothetical protein